MAQAKPCHRLAQPQRSASHQSVRHALVGSRMSAVMAARVQPGPLIKNYGGGCRWRSISPMFGQTELLTDVGSAPVGEQVASGPNALPLRSFDTQPLGFQQERPRPPKAGVQMLGERD